MLDAGFTGHPQCALKVPYPGRIVLGLGDVPTGEGAPTAVQQQQCGDETDLDGERGHRPSTQGYAINVAMTAASGNPFALAHGHHRPFDETYEAPGRRKEIGCCQQPASTAVTHDDDEQPWCTRAASRRKVLGAACIPRP